MKYNISIKVDARFDTEVEADSFEEAFEIAKDKTFFAKAESLEWVGVEPVHAEREDGKEADYNLLPYDDD